MIEQADRGEELVQLVFVTDKNHVPMARVPWQMASDYIRMWYDAREAISKGSKGSDEAKQWLEQGTLAMNHEISPGRTLAGSAVAMEHVVGIYVSWDRGYDSSQYQLAQAQKQIADMMEKGLELERKKWEDEHRGDSWKDREED